MMMMIHVKLNGPNVGNEAKSKMKHPSVMGLNERSI